MTRRPWTADNGPRQGTWVVTGPEDPRLRADVLTQRLPAETFTASTTLTLTGGHAGLAVLGDTYAWVGLEYATAGPWVGAVLALFAGGEAGHAEFGGFTVTAMSGDMTQRGRSNDSTL